MSGIERVTGSAMSCDVSVVVVGGARRLAASALRRVADLERRWSRFDNDSEISVLNRTPDRPVTVSEPTRQLVVALIEGWYATRGAFDPTLLGAMVRNGYRASRTDASRRTSLRLDVDQRGRPDHVLVDHASSTVQLPRGTALDPGGLGKGFAADLVVAELLGDGAAGVLVSIGGDIAVSGEAPEGDAWTVAVEHEPGVAIDTVRLQRGGVVTSTTRRRTWRLDDRVMHHLLDPATRQPTTNGVFSASVVAGSARWAEVLTKPAFVRSDVDALAMAESAGAGMSISLADGEVITNSSWRRFAVVGSES